jgi:hypothetical protein
MTTTSTTTHDAVDETVDDARSKVDQVRDAVGTAVEHVPEVLDSARSGAEGAAERARIGVEETTTRLQTLPDDTLRLMAAATVGLAAGLYLAGAPRLVTLAAAAPAILAGAAIATRSKPRSASRS